jgi:hypothetical protein
MRRTAPTTWPITRNALEQRGLPLSPSEAFETQSRCEARIAKRVDDTQRFVADLNHGAGSTQRFHQTLAEGGATGTITTTDAGDDSVWKIDMRCLPDSVDPRGLSARPKDETNK